MIVSSVSKNLDSTRGLAALIVLISHIHQWFILPIVGVFHLSSIIFFYLSFFSVLVFFSLSGFVITHSIVSNYRRNGFLDTSAFIHSRITRIVPPGIAAIIFSLFVGFFIIFFGLHGSESFRLETDLYVARESISFSFRNIISCFIFSNGIIPGTNAIITNGPLWSLSIEFYAYFISLSFAFCFYFYTTKKYTSSGYFKFFALIFILFLIQFVSRPVDVLQYFFYWSIGAFLFLYKKNSKFITKCFICMGLFSILIFAFLVHYDMFDLVNAKGINSLLFVPINASFLLLLSIFLFNCKIPFQIIFIFISRSSYTLYVFHFPILCLLFSFFHHDFVNWSNFDRSVFLILICSFILIISHILSLFLEDKLYWKPKFLVLISWIMHIISLFYKKVILRF